MTLVALTAFRWLMEAGETLAWAAATDTAGALGEVTAGAKVLVTSEALPLGVAAAAADVRAAAWQTPAALAVVVLTILALGWRVRASARRRRRGCGGGGCSAVSPDVERLRVRLTTKPDR
jgi:hypothetical protein